MRNIMACLRPLSSWKVYLAKNPAELPAKSICLFPYQPNMLCCGLAGLLAIKNEGSAAGRDPVCELPAAYAEIVEFALDAVMDGQVADFLVSEELLRQMAADLFHLKQDLDLQYSMHASGSIERMRDLARDLEAFVAEQDVLIEKHADSISTKDMEIISGRLIILKDVLWGLQEDLLSNQDKILDLYGAENELTDQAFKRLQRFNFVLNSLDRLEVRGRDSTGIQLNFLFNDAVSFADLLAVLKDVGLDAEFEKRIQPGDLMNGSISYSPEGLIFTYKTASVTGKLGRNCRMLRKSMKDDEILHFFLSYPGCDEMYLAHTRWASVGAINEHNCHPLNNHAKGSSERDYPAYGNGSWYINVALNGDIDNYAELRAGFENDGVQLDANVTTDTKVIPMKIEEFLRKGHDLKEAMRLALNTFEGSHAIACESNLEPGKVFLAQRGSGQSIYVGLGEQQYSFSSEIYGLVEETPRFIKMDGELEHEVDGKVTRGQLFTLSNDKGADLAGIEACFYDGHPIALTEADIQVAEITTRDIDRRGFSHYLIKEILDAPGSIRKTLRGKYRIEGGEVTFNLDEEVVPQATCDALASGKIRRIYVVGQGTAAVAGCAISEALNIYLKGTHINVQAKTASDLSGFGLDDDLSDSMVIAVTQSGTTTDTNRAVAMVAKRGAHVIAIVNRRQSDITTKASGVYYTSDGRDIEMSVASTKAFYSQICAGYVLALYFARLTGSIAGSQIARELNSLEKIPRLMNRVIARRDSIKATAWQHVRNKKYWAVVGSGTNKVASDEVRIKLSELCYKTISSDIIEDKKHIDLSSEPLILVMAAGSPEIVLEDIVKDTAIFKAHAARVVVIADEGEFRFDKVADEVIQVPRAPFPLSVILNTLAGHIWGYYAASSLDEQAEIFKQFRTNLSVLMAEHTSRGLSTFESLADRELHRIVDEFSKQFNPWRSSGALATMSIETASDIMLLLKYAAGKLPLEEFWIDFEDKRISSSPLDMLDLVLGKAIDELARPIDAIRHQAKTVTVGTSRKVEKLEGILFDMLAEHGYSMENLKAKDGYTLKRLQRAVKGINGYTLYSIKGLDEEGMPSNSTIISIEKRDGIANKMDTRISEPKPVRGTKKSILRTGDVYAGAGKSDDASIIAIPLIGEGYEIDHILLAHVEFDDALVGEDRAAVLGEKYNDIRNMVDERNLDWKDDLLNGISMKYLLGEAADVIAAEIQNKLEH